MSGRHSGGRTAELAPPGPPPRPEPARGRRRRRRRAVARHPARRWVAGLLGALLVAGAGLAVAGHRDRPARTAAAPVSTAQRTVLVGYGEPGQPGTAAAMLGAVPASGPAAAGPAGAMLLLPGTLTDPGPAGSVAGAFAAADPSVFPGSVADLLGVRVDLTWRLTPEALAGLVDRLGRISVEVDSAVPAAGLNAGSQRLTGAQAAAYAGYGADGDTDVQRADRFRRVLNGLLAALPATPAAVAATLGSLGAGSDVTDGTAGPAPAGSPTASGTAPAGPSSTGTTSAGPPGTAPSAAAAAAGSRAALAGLLVALARSDVAEHEQVVPTTLGGAGYQLDRGAEAALAAQLFGGASTRADSGSRVEVINDSGVPDLADSARTRLRAARLTLVKAVNDDPFGQFPRTQVMVFDSSATALALGHRVAAALGLPAAPVVVSNQVSVVTDAIAVLAADYQP